MSGISLSQMSNSDESKNKIAFVNLQKTAQNQNSVWT
jgi:hypothetical protein